MKKFLSLMLAVLMVVGMVPSFVFGIGAEGIDGAENAASSDFPKLVITEVHPNSINYNSNRNSWAADSEIGSVFYPTPDYTKGAYYTARNPKVGDNVSSYYELVEKNGKAEFVKTSDATAVAGKNYYSSQDPNSIYDVFEYIEIYNSGTEAVNLYDYKMMYDRDANYDQNSDVKFAPLSAGGVSSTFHKSHFEKVAVAEGESVSGLYTCNTSASYNVCAADAVAVAGTEYYRLVENEYYVENPETAILEPGECAVIWFYSWGDWLTCETLDGFKAYYEWRYSEAKRGSYGVDLSDTLVLAVDAWTDCWFGHNGAFDVQDGGSRIYGVANKSVVSTLDTARFDQWESWAYWSAYVGIDLANTAKAITVEVGVTKVNGGDVAVLLPDTGVYAFPNLADGTCDANGNAVLGHTYYKVNINDGSNKSPYANKTDTSSANFLYGFNATASIKEGWPYTITNWDLNPGVLTNVQKDVFPNGSTKTTVPELVITEISPDTVGGDYYEFAEVTNTSGAAINIYDYTFLARTSSYQSAIGNEYFNRFNTIIPGNVGNILAADPGSYYYDKAPTNPEYDAGWLQPGESAVLWSYYSETYAVEATFEDFRAHYNMDDGIKLFAMDADNSARTGRPNERQNLGNSGFYMYGLAKNDDLLWYSDPYVSNVVMSPITFTTGTTQKTALGIPLADATSYVLANSMMVSGQNVGLGEGYGYQFVWNRTEGTNNKCGALMDITRMVRHDGDSKFVMSGTVVDDQWLSTPGVLCDGQKTSMTTNTGASRYVVYMKDFDGAGTVSGYDEVAELLGITGVKDNEILNDEHKLNVKETEAKGVEFLEIRDGKLYVNNYGSSDDYMLLLSDDVLTKLRDSNFTIEYSMTYDATMVNGNNGYSTVLYNFNGSDMSYGASIIRVSGYGNNAVYMNNQMSSIEDLSTTAGAGANMNATDLKGAPTLYEILTKKDESVVGNSSSLDGSVVLAGKTLNVKVDVSITTGVTVTVNGVVVSKSYDVVDSAMFSNWGLFLEKTVGTDLVLKTTPNVSVSYDYITVYTDAIGTNVNDLDIPDLYITELLMDCGGWDFLQDPNKTSGTLNWIEYIEVTNGSDKPVALKNYSIVSTTRDGYLHEGNNLMWKGDGNRGEMNFDTWLGTDDYKAKITKDGVVYNPSENEAVLQPGESILIFTVDTNTSLSQLNMNGTTTDLISAARSWLQLPDDQLCMVTTKKEATIEDVDAETLATVGNPARKDSTFNNWNSAACVYGVGRNYDYKGNPVDWMNTYTHDYRNIESFVNFLPAIAVGQNSTGYLGTADDRANGGSALTYPCHFTYGADGSSYYKQGLLFTRRQAPAITRYNADGSVAATGQYNAGKLYQIQQSAFNDIRALKNQGFSNGGGLVITEMIMHTNDSLNTNYQAFEAMEITNTATYPVNLYDYSLAKADDGTYGNPNSWGLVNTLRAGTPVSRYHVWFDQLQDFVNPEDGMVQPGETIVIWMYTLDTYNFATKNPDLKVDVEAFRDYWADRNNDVIKATDESGEYTTRVFTTVHVDAHATFNGYDQATTNYAIVKKTQFAFGSKIARASTIVSSTFSPHYSMYYDLSWKLVQLVPASTYLTMPLGGSLATSFGWHEELVEEVDITAELNPTNLCIKNEDGTYSFAATPYDASNTYYRLYYYFNVQSVSANAEDDLSFNYIYGSTLTNSWNRGGTLASVKASYYMVNNSGMKWSTNPDDVDATPLVRVDLDSIGAGENSLGYLIGDQKGMVAAVNFDYVGELDDGTKVYFHKNVAGDLSGLNVQNGGADVIFSGSGTQITFGASVSTALYAALTNALGEEYVSVGMITVRAEDALKAGMIRPAMLENAGITFVNESDLDTNASGGRRHFYSSAQQMQAGYYADTYSAVGYIRMETCIGAITLYANTAENQSATQVLASEVEDYSDVQTDEYCYQVESGKWSRYTAEQRERFAAMCAR